MNNKPYTSFSDIITMIYLGKERGMDCPPMDDHPLILDILMERIQELSVKPDEEVLLLIGHGADEGE